MEWWGKQMFYLTNFLEIGELIYKVFSSFKSLLHSKRLVGIFNPLLWLQNVKLGINIITWTFYQAMWSYSSSELIQIIWLYIWLLMLCPIIRGTIVSNRGVQILKFILEIFWFHNKMYLFLLKNSNLILLVRWMEVMLLHHAMLINSVWDHIHINANFYIVKHAAPSDRKYLNVLKVTYRLLRTSQSDVTVSHYWAQHLSG